MMAGVLLGCSDDTTSPKPVAAEPSDLEIIAPSIDFARTDTDLLAYIEGIEIANPHQMLNSTDRDALFTMVLQAYELKKGDTSADPLIRDDCDVVEVLAYNIPEVSALRESDSKSSVSLKELSEILMAYWTGQNEIP